MFVLFLSSQTIIRKVSFNLFQGELEIEIQEKEVENSLVCDTLRSMTLHYICSSHSDLTFT